MTAKVYSLSARRMVKPEPGEVEVVLRDTVWIFESPKHALDIARRIQDAAFREQGRAKKEAIGKGASRLFVYHSAYKGTLDRAAKIAVKHDLDTAEIWTRPTPRTHAACVELWLDLGDCATTIAECLDISVHGVRRDLRKAREEQQRRWAEERKART